MEKYYRERFETQQRIAKKLAYTLEVNEILEMLREETRHLVPSAMEVCILLLDRDAKNYTRPLQCALYGRPVNCLSCKRNRTAVLKALERKKGIVISRSEPVLGGIAAPEPIYVNMGINSGSALVGMTRFKGSMSTRMTYTASGRVTNIAARLSDLAKKGDTLIGEETARLIEGLWPVFDRGKVILKGIDEPLRVYSLRSVFP